jgi:uncharacterized protein YdbL (DUF1318 family)
MRSPKFWNSSLATMLAAFLLPALALTVAPATAIAQTAAEKTLVDGAKARGLVGEQGDGFLGFVAPSTDPMLAAAVAAINAGRMQVYRETAMRTGVSVEAAGQATAQQLFMRLPPGQFFKPLTGDWTRKT